MDKTTAENTRICAKATCQAKGRSRVTVTGSRCPAHIAKETRPGVIVIYFQGIKAKYQMKLGKWL